MIRVFKYLILLLFLSAQVFAAEGPYYIDGTSGNNGNTGLSDAQAWADFTNVDNAGFQPSTDVYVKTGTTVTLSSDVDLNWSGTLGDRVVFGCYWLDGGSPNTDCTGKTRPIIYLNDDNGQFFDFHDEDYITWEHLYMEIIDSQWEDCRWGGPGSGTGIGSSVASYTGDGYLTVNDCYFKHIGHYVFTTVDEPQFIIFTNNTCDAVGNCFYPGQEDADEDGAGYVYAANNTCTGVVGYEPCPTKGSSTHLDGGINSSTQNITVDSTAIFSAGWDILVDGEYMNVISVTDATHLYVTRGTWNSPAVSHSDNATVYVVSVNTKVDGHCMALQGVHHAIVEDNTSTDNYGVPFITWAQYIAATGHSGDTHDTVFRGNKGYNNKRGGIYICGGNDPTSLQNLVYQNIFTNSCSDYPDENTDRPSIRFNKMPNNSIGNRAFNNTIFNTERLGIGIKDTVYYIYYKNNIVTTDDLTSYMYGTDGDSPSDSQIDYNLYWAYSANPASSSLWQNESNQPRTFAEWQSDGFDVHGDVGAPLFSDPDDPNNDYTLQISSPAINTGFYLTHVSQSGSSTQELYVADTYWFHGDFGLVDEDGAAINGMALTLYDETNGAQQVTIDEVTITHGTPGNFTLDQTVDYIYDGDHLDDPASTTQIALTFYGVKPDIGAEEYPLQVTDVSPADGDTGVSTTADGSCDYPSGVDDIDWWLYENDCGSVTCGDGGSVASGDDDSDKVMDFGTMTESATHCLGIKANAGPTLQGTCQEFEFTTTNVIPPTTGLTPAEQDAGGAPMSQNSGGTPIVIGE